MLLKITSNKIKQLKKLLNWCTRAAYLSLSYRCYIYCLELEPCCDETIILVGLHVPRTEVVHVKMNRFCNGSIAQLSEPHAAHSLAFVVSELWPHYTLHRIHHDATDTNSPLSYMYVSTQPHIW